MKRGITALLTAVFLAGIGTAQAYIETDLITDGGFDTLTGNEPEAGGSPWNSTETGNGLKVINNLEITEPNGLSWEWYGATAATFQDLGVTVQSGKDYEVSLWHAVRASHASYTNDTKFAVSVYTSPSLGGTYTFVAGRTNLSAGAEDTFYNLNETFTAAELAGVVGQYMQLRIGKVWNGNTKYRLLVDEVKFGPTGPLPAGHSTLAYFDTTFTSPDFIVAGLSATFAGGNGVKNNFNSTDGTFGTIVNPGADVQPTSALTLVTANESKRTVTLTLENTSTVDIYLDDLNFDYGRANDDAPDAVTVSTSGNISVITNNYTGISKSLLKGDADDFTMDLTGLGDSTLEPGEQAVITFYLEGAAGSWVGTMLDNVLVGGSVYTPPLHPTLATFDTTFTSPDFAVPELTGAWSDGHTIPRTDANSTDGTFGTILNPSAEIVTLGAVAVDSNKPIATLTLNNTSAKEIFLDDISFDVGRFFAGAPSNFVLTTSGNITATTLTNASGIVVMGKVGDADDFDVELTGLPDQTLEPGGEAVFTFTFSGATDLASSIIDNILIGGTVSDASVLLLDPSDKLELFITDVSDVVSNSIAVSYTDGTPPTNVYVSSVSVLNDASGAFSVLPTSFTLNDPAPSNELVYVTFDNNTALLTTNQVATADVQVIWNKIGYASSTSTIPVSATFLGVHSGNILAAFNDETSGFSPNNGEADIAFLGIDAFLSGLPWGNNNDGSSDTTYGTIYGNARTDAGVATCPSGTVITIAFTNNTEGAVELDGLYFDSARKYFDGSLDIIEVSLSGDLGNEVLGTFTGLVTVAGLGDFSDFDIPLTGLSDRSLAVGEAIAITFDYSGVGDICLLDNIAILGAGSLPAQLLKTPEYDLNMGVSGLDDSVAEEVWLRFIPGDANTNVVITAVSFSNETHVGAFGYTDTFPYTIPEAYDATNVFALSFDNTVADLAAGESASAVVIVEWHEIGDITKTFEFDASASRPADVPFAGIVALFDTGFLVPDAAYNGILGEFTEGTGLEFDNKGSEDGTYGSLATPPAPTTNVAWRFEGLNPVSVLTITNKTTAAFELSTFNFDIGTWWDGGATELTLSVSGDVTADPALLTTNITVLNGGSDYDDHDIDLTGLADHTLGGGEVVIFTFTLVPEGNPNMGVWIDNIALMGPVDQLGGWSAYYGLTAGVNDGPNQNPDGDSRDNLMEYATGGNPMEADGSTTVLWESEEGGTNWFYHVHAERTDDDSLTYGVSERGNLQFGDWSADLTPVGVTSGPGLWKTVTNRTDIGNAEFIRLQVEQNN